MTTAERIAAMKRLEYLEQIIDDARWELWDAECRDDDEDADLAESNLYHYQRERDELLSRFPEVKYWPAPTTRATAS